MAKYDNELREAFMLIEERLSGDPKYAAFVDQLRAAHTTLVAEAMTAKEAEK